jgi:hypothetical protein
VRHGAASEVAHRDADQRTQHDLQRHEQHPVTHGLDLSRTGAGEHDEQDRQHQAVVQTALHVQSLADADGNERVADDRLPQRRVRRSQNHGQRGRLPDIHRVKDQRGDAGAQQDGQRQTDSQQPHRKIMLAPQQTQVDARGIGEQHQHQCQLGQQVDPVTLQAGIDEAQQIGADDQTKRGEEHRRRDRALLQSPGDHAEAEDASGDDDEPEGIHWWRF